MAPGGLLAIAPLSVILDEIFPPEHKPVWLQTTHPRCGVVVLFRPFRPGTWNSWC